MFINPNAPKPIFPRIEIMEHHNGSMYYETYVRKAYRKYFFMRKKYYLWHHIRTVRFDKPQNHITKLLLLQGFLKEVYATILVGIVNPKLTEEEYGQPIYRLDPDQTEESKRVLNFFQPSTFQKL